LPMPSTVMRRFGPDGYICALQQPNRDHTITAVFTRRFDQPHGISRGWMGAGAVRLAEPRDGQLALCEGVETALAVMELTNTACWAVLGCWRLHQIAIPRAVKLLHLFADHDVRGLQALERATQHYSVRGFRVRKHIPLYPGDDYNDLLVLLKAQEL